MEDWARVGGGGVDRFSIDFRQIFDRFSIDFRGLGDDWRRPSYAPVWGLCADLLKKRETFAKIVEIPSK